MKVNLSQLERPFAARHFGPSEDEIDSMLEKIGCSSLDDLIQQTIPESILSRDGIELPEALSEFEFLNEFKKIMDQNQEFKSYIGMGYYPCITPSVIQRNILENPGWYTAYTPYQAEIAQGRLEALINFQTAVIDLTGMEVANASLLDEGTAAAEAMSMFYSRRKGSKKDANTFFADELSFPQTLDVLKTRASSFGINLRVGSLESLDINDPDLFGIFVQFPNDNGEVIDHSELIQKAHDQDIKVVVAADLMSLICLHPPGDIGADAVVGTTQRFGIPMGYGGPHAAYFATLEENKRQMPGRIIGVTKDANGRTAYRMALQTREQHIRRERATSNICTAQVLLAVMSGMYAVYHGQEGLKQIALRIAGLSQCLNKQLHLLGFDQVNKHFFDTVKIAVKDVPKLRKIAEARQINFRYFGDNFVGISLNECTSLDDIEEILYVFASYQGKEIIDLTWRHEADECEVSWPENLQRKSSFLNYPVFRMYQTEHELLRYLKRLENKDLSLVHSMISLGSCTMKLNATTEMIPVTWSKIGNLHPFAPQSQCNGYLQMINTLTTWLAEITGFHTVSVQPNSGAQGEYAGLMVIKAYHEDRGEGHRNIALIPSSAHGTNPASAVMAGYDVVIVACDDHGNIDLADIQTKTEKYGNQLAALLITYPSTHGVFEEDIVEICDAVHKYGGQVYMDGANMNAQVGLTNPAVIGADVCHLNLHKTFCIPHGGGGPGVGPIGVASHLAPFLPGNPVMPTGGEKAISAISSAPYGSASILAISYAYIAMMGKKALTQATRIAILSANYIKERLAPHYDILYSGKQGRCAHEMIIDCRQFKKAGIEVADLAKRLMDYGFHAPTVSFPVPGTMMIEPTESESLAELDRFCDALISIRKEISAVEQGAVEAQNNVLKNAPHTYEMVVDDTWDFPYSRKEAAFPLEFVRHNKFWPAVRRVDDAYGDRNLMCTCPPMEVYQSLAEEVELNLS